MPGEITGILHKAPLLLMGEERCLCVDTNCQRKSITVPVTVVLELFADVIPLRGRFGNPRQMNLFPGKRKFVGQSTCTSVRTRSSIDH